MQPVFDVTDQEIVNGRAAARELLTGPLLGDFVRLLDGSLRRISVIHESGKLQLLWEHVGCPAAGSFHLFAGGGMDFSGTPGPLLLTLSQLAPTDEKRYGACWIFHHGQVEAGNRVDSSVLCRVYQEAG